jgi:hypothetical protein
MAITAFWKSFMHAFGVRHAVTIGTLVNRCMGLRVTFGTTDSTMFGAAVGKLHRSLIMAGGAQHGRNLGGIV